MHVLDVGLAYPGHYVDQPTVARTLARLWTDSGRSSTAVERLHAATGVTGRHFTDPIDRYAHTRSFGEANDRFIEVGTALATDAIDDALARAGIRARDVDCLTFVSTTGVASPSIDARLVHRVGFRDDVRRLPLVGLGCSGGAAGLARCADMLQDRPNAVGVIVCVELCSLTFQPDDTSTANLIATGLFADAAACAVVSGAARARPRAPAIVGSRSLLLAGTEHVLGFHVDERGFRLILREELQGVAGRGLGQAVDGLLDGHGIARVDVGIWIVHPGGPKILAAVERALALPPAALERSRRCLQTIGNVSSASVLCILREVLADPPRPGTYGVIVGMGPGFSIDALLLRW